MSTLVLEAVGEMDTKKQRSPLRLCWYTCRSLVMTVSNLDSRSPNLAVRSGSIAAISSNV
jgi:hypothetical protein